MHIWAGSVRQEWLDFLKIMQEAVIMRPVQGLRDTTKARDGLQRVPLMCGIGEAVFVNDISPAEITSAAAALKSFALQTSQSSSENNNIVAAPAKIAMPV